jgi:hypothetical protein
MANDEPDPDPHPLSPQGILNGICAELAQSPPSRLAGLTLSQFPDTAATSAQARTAYAALLPELRQWRAAGLSYRDIAAMLNGEGRTTRTGAPWNHNQVKRVLSRVEG